MRKELIGFAALVAAALLGAAVWAADAPPKVPTGYQVAGCGPYELRDGRVIQHCDATSPRTLLWSWRTKAPDGGGKGVDSGSK
jgi:hypothetical protein